MSAARATESPSKLTINKENLTGPATISELNAVAEQVNILVSCSETHARKLDDITRILKVVAQLAGVSAEVLDDNPNDDDLATNLEDAMMITTVPANQGTTVRGRIGQRHKPAMTMCIAAIARARSAWRRRGMSRDPSHEQGARPAISTYIHGYLDIPWGTPGYLDVTYYRGRMRGIPSMPDAPKRDDSPKAMFRKMDGAAVGSGAAAGGWGRG